MLNVILICIVCIALAMSLLIGIYALFRSQSYKKNYFLLLQAMIIIYLLGYLLELTSINTDEAYTAVRVLYLGSSFVASFSLFFIADYCNIKLSLAFVKIPMVILALAITIAMWTTKYHHLIYADYSYSPFLVHHLEFTPGSLYFLIRYYPPVFMVMAMAVLIYQMQVWKNEYRKQLLILLVCVAIPFAAECIHALMMYTGATARYIYLTPYSLAIMSFCLYVGVIRFNIFDAISVAAVTAMENISDGFILVDENDNYLASNAATAKILPGISKLLKGESIFAIKDWPLELKSEGKSSIEFSVTNGITKHYIASIDPILARDKAVRAKIILFRETTESVNLLRELENAAYIDALTGLYNRKHFMELAEVDIGRALRQNQLIYTAMLDLDFFKKVNDTYGHAAGDMVLKAIAGIMRQTIRSYDLLCRYGGEEFLILLTALDVPDAFTLVERIRENIERSSLRYEKEVIKITCSIGLAKFIESDTLECSIKKADEALYAAKNGGRNQVRIYEPVSS